MARPLRVNVPDGWYHLTARGNERRAIFTHAREYRHFLDLVEEWTERCRVVVAAFALMPNHYHLLVRMPAGNLSAAVQWLNVSYAVWFNRRHQRAGHLFQGRFGSVLLGQEGAWVLEVCDYVHLNPVRLQAAGLGKAARRAEEQGWLPAATPAEVTGRLDHLRRWRWSSYRAYAGYEPAPPWLSLVLLDRLGQDAAEAKARYRERLEGRLRQGIKESWRVRAETGLALSSAEFLGWLRAAAQGRSAEETGARQLRRAVSLSEIKAAVAKVKGLAWEAFANRHGDWGRDLALALARRYGGMSLRQIGEAAGGMHYAAVSDAVRRLERRRERDAELGRAWEQATRFLNLDSQNS